MNISLIMDINTFKRIAGDDEELWKIFSTANHTRHGYSNAMEYELAFREIVFECDRIVYKLNGVEHRSDGPAVITKGGSKQWYFNGLRHRSDGPAYEDNEVQIWYVNGLKHRLDGPAEIYYSGNKYWYVNGLKHRLDGPAVELIGNKLFNGGVWYANGLKHRLDGPAIDYDNGEKTWFVNGKLHRTDGPAVEWNNRLAWYDNGVLIERIEGENLLEDTAKRIRQLSINNKRIKKSPL